MMQIYERDHVCGGDTNYIEMDVVLPSPTMFIPPIYQKISFKTPPFLLTPHFNTSIYLRLPIARYLELAQAPSITSLNIFYHHTPPLCIREIL